MRHNGRHPLRADEPPEQGTSEGTQTSLDTPSGARTKKRPEHHHQPKRHEERHQLTPANRPSSAGNQTPHEQGQSDPLDGPSDVRTEMRPRPTTRPSATTEDTR
jgi:hypothetical protein